MKVRYIRAIHQRRPVERGVCVCQCGRPRTGQGLSINQTSKNEQKIAFRESVLESDPPPRRFLRTIWSGSPLKGGGSSERTILDREGGSKKSVFARTSLMDDPKSILKYYLYISPHRLAKHWTTYAFQHSYWRRHRQVRSFEDTCSLSEILVFIEWMKYSSML